MTITQAAYRLGRDGILNDPSDEDIILAAVELARGNWPNDFSVDRWFGDRLVEQYERGAAEYRRVGI